MNIIFVMVNRKLSGSSRSIRLHQLIPTNLTSSHKKAPAKLHQRPFCGSSKTHC